jgi:hypothetical protein
MVSLCDLEGIAKPSEKNNGGQCKSAEELMGFWIEIETSLKN